ncbi:hypothetical protein M3599_17705 [Niallia circulans]|uniref:hypothetical protein n=1 Tax=Niallia circulans TaxID=1397 RepID=UPI00203F9CDC|nr:hypothetical protein [Niallia circulans]MCM2982764.1 hypothetical protein [Niallia circulans]
MMMVYGEEVWLKRVVFWLIKGSLAEKSGVLADKIKVWLKSPVFWLIKRKFG